MAQKQNVDPEELKLVVPIERWNSVTAKTPCEPLNQWTVHCTHCNEDLPISTGNIGTFEHTCADGMINHFEIYWPGHTPGKDPEEVKITVGGHELQGLASGEEVNIPSPPSDEQFKFTIGQHGLQGQPPKGHIPGEEVIMHPNDPRLNSEQQVNALQAQVGFCQGYIVELEKQLRRFMPDMDQHEDLGERVGKSLHAWQIIQGINTNLQVDLGMADAQMQTLKEKHEIEIADWKQAADLCSGLLKRVFGDEWSEWNDFERLVDHHESVQRHIREDNDNQAAKIVRLEADVRRLAPRIETSHD